MKMSVQQKEAAKLWKWEEEEAKYAEESRFHASYLSKWLRDNVGNTKVPEADKILEEIRGLADKLKNILDAQ